MISTCVLHSRGYTGEVTAVPLARGPRPGPVDALQIVSPLVNTEACYLVPQSAQSARLVAAPRQRGRRPARAAAAGGQRGGRRRGLRQVRLLAHELPEVLLSAASGASACVTWRCCSPRRPTPRPWSWTRSPARSPWPRRCLARSCCRRCSSSSCCS